VRDARSSPPETNGSATDTSGTDGETDSAEVAAAESYEEYDEYAMDEAIAAESDAPDPNESLATAEQTDGAVEDPDALDDGSDDPSG
jgi:hypothetical protein